MPVYNPAGHFYEYQGYANPAQYLAESGQINSAINKLRTNLKLDWELVDGLTLTGQAGVNVGHNDADGIWKTFRTYNWEDNINTIRTWETIQNLNLGFDYAFFVRKQLILYLKTLQMQLLNWD